MRGIHEKPIILVHGGAGSFKNIDKKELREYRSCLEASVDNGYKALLTGNAIDGVIESVKTMEDCGKMNAGTGSVLNLHGFIEMDAGLMDGSTMRAAGVALIRTIKNPILLARIVLENTDHVLLAGDFAEKLGETFGLKKLNLTIIDDKITKYEKYLENLIKGEGFKHLSKVRKLILEHEKLLPDTVGAVALDKEGNLASATSTGGYWLKLPGRIGDTPIVGAGFYATRKAAASSTGIGEYIMIANLCRRAVDYVENGLSAYQAANASINYITGLFGNNNAGIIVIDHTGFIGASFNTAGMGRALLSKSLNKPLIAVYRNEQFI